MQAVVLFLAALLAASALHKLLARERLVEVTARLAGVAMPHAALLLALAATLEALAALALLAPVLSGGAALAAAALWLGYAFALWRQRGKVLDCGCDLVAREKPVDGIAVARPLLLAALALAAALTATPIWTLDAPFAALTLLALWFAGGEILSIPKLARHRP